MMPKGTPSITRGFAADKLSHAGDLKGCFLDELRDFVQRRVLRQLSQGGAYDARTGDADVEHHVRFTDTMKRACHERVVFRRVAEYHQLGSADALAVLGQFCGFAHDLAHHGDGIHVDAGLGGADVDGGADEVRLCERAWDGFDQRAVAGR